MIDKPFICALCNTEHNQVNSPEEIESAFMDLYGETIEEAGGYEEIETVCSSCYHEWLVNNEL